MWTDGRTDGRTHARTHTHISSTDQDPLLWCVTHTVCSTWAEEPRGCILVNVFINELSHQCGCICHARLFTVGLVRGADISNLCSAGIGETGTFNIVSERRLECTTSAMRVSTERTFHCFTNRFKHPHWWVHFEYYSRANSRAHLINIVCCSLQRQIR